VKTVRPAPIEDMTWKCPSPEGQAWWTTTTRGNALAIVGRPIARKTAARLVADIPARSEADAARAPEPGRLPTDKTPVIVRTCARRRRQLRMAFPRLPSPPPPPPHTH
jgi:hypothetical protein